MKKSFINFKSVSILWCLFLLGACSGGGTKQGDTIDSVTTEEPAIVEELSKPIYITQDSIGAIKIGMSINDIPASMEGLYMAKEYGASPDAVTITFKGEEGERFIAYDFGEGKIDVLNLIDSTVKVKSPKGEFGMGDKFSNVLQLPGVEVEWSGYENTGTWYWVWEGLWFTPSQENISESLSHRLYQSIQAPTPADFDDNITIGFIGTGLPF